MKIQFKLIFIYFVLNLINCQNIREHAAELRAVKGQVLKIKILFFKISGNLNKVFPYSL